MKTKNENKLIADFMELKKFGYEGKNFIVLGQHISPEKIPYNTSWSWLMPVVAKIAQIDEVYDIEEFLLIRDELCTARIETVYETVVEFIKYYNKNS